MSKHLELVLTDENGITIDYWTTADSISRDVFYLLAQGNQFYGGAKGLTKDRISQVLNSLEQEELE